MATEAAAARLAKGERIALLNRVIDSRTFAQAPRMREFLRYIVEAAERSDANALSEYAIAVEVFRKHPDFNPATDNIVRVTARHLRQKLQQYFETEGRAEPVQIVIPKGGYTPAFELRASPVPEQESLGQNKPAAPRWRAMALVLLGAIAGAAAVVALRPGVSSPPTVEARREAAGSLVDRMLSSSSVPTLVVISDFSAVHLRAWAGRSVSLQDYVRGDYIQSDWLGRPIPPELEKLHSSIVNSQTTTIGDVLLAMRIMRAAGPSTPQITTQHARDLTPRHFKEGNIILLGGAGSIPWSRIFEPYLGLEQMLVGPSRSGFRRKEPISGRPSEYLNHEPTPNRRVTYARIAFFENPLGIGRVLMLSGSSMVATEAAGNFVLDPASYRNLFQQLDRPSGSPLPNFEAFLAVEESSESQGVGTQVSLEEIRPLRIEVAGQKR
ncbi:MAG: hypothetical protein ACK5AZ_20920 [Bryobacteraceae bacterium]